MCRTLNIASAICCLLSLYYFSLCLYGSHPRSSAQSVQRDRVENRFVGARGNEVADEAE
jgi:hypothetical protein